MALSDKRILEHIEKGNVIIEPFFDESLNTSSYDVCLGEWYYRKNALPAGQTFFSPYSEEDISNLWGEPQLAKPAHLAFPEANLQIPRGFSADDRVIILRPNELILGHTVEFIGGKNVIVGKMQARSTFGRLDYDVCSDAGWGDVGYFSRWTMEIRSRFDDRLTALIVGSPIAQIVFEYTGEIRGDDYTKKGNYQVTSDLIELQHTWKPQMMLPKPLKVNRALAAWKLPT